MSAGRSGEPFSRVLVANRGEIALRILATLRRMGISGAVAATRADHATPAAAAADLVIGLGDGPLEDTYLSVERIVDAARRAGAEAVHPGYGFLSESPALATACREAGLVFIGPPAEAIALMGDKIAAKAAVAAAGVPVVPGHSRPGASQHELRLAAQELGPPLLVKAAAGGGGRGMREVHRPDDLPAALEAARREAAAAFGDASLLLERLVTPARHLEVQVLADAHGTVWGLTERECTLQRRHQKVVEESPSPVLHPRARARMIEAAVTAARACRYENAGTVEFLVPGETAADADTAFWFLEMNTRLQVEHPVTEEVHGLDLVAWQVRIAAGATLPSAPPPARGHAIEARVYAEDPTRGFLPTGGRVLAHRRPDLRVDAGVAVGTVVGTVYDPLLAKVVATGADRAEALRRLRRGLAGFVTLGVTNNVAFLRALLDSPEVAVGHLDTGLVARVRERGTPEDPETAALVPVVAALAWVARDEEGGAALHRGAPRGWRLRGCADTVLAQEVDGQGLARRHRTSVDGDAAGARVRVDDGTVVDAALRHLDPTRAAVTVDGIERTWDLAHDGGVLHLGLDGRAWAVREVTAVDAAAEAVTGVTGPVTAPMPGTVTVLDVAVGEPVRAGQRLLVVEAMKMEHPVTAPADGTVTRVGVRVGERVGRDEILVVVDGAEVTDAGEAAAADLGGERT